MAEQKGQNQPKQQDVNQLLQIRREKLADLQAAGKDPFEITKYERHASRASATRLPSNFKEKLL